MAMRNSLTAARLREVLEYYPDAGVFVWKVSVNSRAQAGTLAGHTDATGYHYIAVDGLLYRAHRLAWLWMTGAWPIQFIDHINVNRGDNRWKNLREASHSQNMANRTMPSQGISRRKNNTWRAHVTRDGKTHWLGTFPTAELALAARQKAAKAIHGEFAK